MFLRTEGKRRNRPDSGAVGIMRQDDSTPDAKTKPREWYLPNRDGGDRLGPYQTEEIRSLLRKGEIRVDEYVFGTHFTSSRWERIQAIEDFKEAVVAYPKAKLPKRHSKGLASLKNHRSLNFIYRAAGELGSKNIYRRFPRAPFHAEAIVHNGERYFRCDCSDISERGVFIHCERQDLFDVSEEVTITIRDPKHLQTFSAHGVVMRVHDKEGTPGMGIAFIRINPKIRRRIAHYVLDVLQAETASHAGTESRSKSDSDADSESEVA